ncbi:outer membrane protein [Chthonobacter albigriseus]|uniref:outer membrane protein n=1 Tax=Chthonobacter albigriseus TaxID=1683161 RepID=UPI0015EF5E0C|nr:outer membrane protein [Chthonobacter albigriseus]
MNRVIAALFAGSAVLVAAPAFAADLPEPIPAAPMAETMVEPTAFDWTGTYIGADAGYVFGDDSAFTDAFAAGAFVGYNYAVTPNWVVGGEADFHWFGSDEGFATALGDTGSTSDSYLSTVRARVGYAFDSVLVYGTAGLAVGFGEVDLPGGSDSNTHVGYVVGAGVEAALTENVTVRGEYNYIDAGSETYSDGTDSADLDFTGHLVKVGVGYKF